ncbi:MAG: cell division protein FtsQ/DivIB [Pseudomonadota bacterium]
MPKVSAFDDDDFEIPARRADANVSSVVFGLMIIVALVVSAAAWMGGSMAKVEAGIGNALDTVARSTGLAVDDVVVLGLDGQPRLRDDIRAAAMVEPGENMWRADPHRIRARVEQTGRVVNVSVHRLWPDQVVITASPAKPTALWHDGGSWHVIDGLGQTMQNEPPAAHPTLLKINGPGADAAMPDLQAALDAAPSLRGRIQMAQWVDGRRWDILMQSGLIVRLPGKPRLAEAIERLETLNRQHALVDRPLSLADFRLPDRIFLRPSKDTRSPSAQGEA